MKRAGLCLVASVAVHAGVGAWVVRPSEAVPSSELRPTGAARGTRALLSTGPMPVELWQPPATKASEGARAVPSAPVRRLGVPPRAGAQNFRGGQAAVEASGLPAVGLGAGGHEAAAEKEEGALGSGAAGNLAALHQRLAASAQRCYPPAARRFRLEGEVSVLFCVTPGGEIASLKLLGSSGAPLLDRAAQECVVQGAQPLPISGGCYQVPVRFGRE